MSDDRLSDGRFWLLTGEVPAGPYTVSQIHSSLAAGEATWQTPACPVGGGAWLPLLRTPGFGPAETPVSLVQPTTPSEPSANECARPSAEPALAASAPAPAKAPVAADYNFPKAAAPSESPEVTGVRAIALVFLLILGFLVGITVAGYGIYEWVRPLSATEVCAKFGDAKTAAEAKKFATPRMHAVIDLLYLQKTADDPNDTFELTQEVDVKTDTKMVGFRASWFDSEAGKRVKMEGAFVMLKADGWKVDDLIITGMEGMSLPGPFSFVDEYQRSKTKVTPGAPKATSPSGLKGQEVIAVKLAGDAVLKKNWFQKLPAAGQKGVLGGIGVAVLTVLGGAWNRLRGKSNAQGNV